MLQRIRVDSIMNEAALDATLPGVFEYFPDAIIRADGEACITYMTRAAEQMLGLALIKARGHALDKLISLQDGETGQPIRILDLPRKQPVFSGAFPLLMSNGSGLVPVQFSIAPTSSAGFGSTHGYVVSLRDARGLQQHIDKLQMQTMHD